MRHVRTSNEWPCCSFLYYGVGVGLKSLVLGVIMARLTLLNLATFLVIPVSIGNYTVREVLMKNRMRVWQNVYNIEINILPNTSEIFH